MLCNDRKPTRKPNHETCGTHSLATGRRHDLCACRASLHHRCTECAEGSRHHCDAGSARGRCGNHAGALRCARYGCHTRRGRARRPGDVRDAIARCLATALLLHGCRRQWGPAGAGGERHRPHLCAWQRLRCHRHRHRPHRQRHRCELVERSERQARSGQDCRFLLSLGAQRHRGGQAACSGLLQRSCPARLFRRLLQRRPHGDDGSRSLSDGLRRHHRRRSRHGLQLGDAALRRAEGGAVIARRRICRSRPWRRSTRW